MSSGSENCRPLENLLTIIESPAHGSLLAAQPSEVAVSARMECLSWRKYIFRQEVVAGFLLDLIYLTPLIIISWPKWIFRHEGLATVLRDGIWSLGTQSHSPDENRPCFRSGGQAGGCSDLAHWVCSAVPSVENFSLHLYALHPNLSVLWVKILLRSAGACPCLLWEYVRCPVGMIFYITAHQSSICLSLLYAKFALPMDMTTLISKVTSPAFPIDMTII